ncbi:MAG: hypothetical protein BGN95_08270 [Sphingomonas sp. 66-10]|uniref:lasso peptide biosynthesis B2 protein n=1 Tax=Sphingomonas sp. 66-10 TaxID=1895848 RepID=UPI00092640D0|nr:lasso peptide biosynthesis B2 protein [Sphingomonas sp. 66-10]OJU23298.1 MAG: hypothetical protein BGN95_08270 [Sphingomonas sp. 66-10]
METLRLRTGISHRTFADCAIILDIDRDRYWRVGRDLAMGLDWIAGRRAGPIAPETCSRLDDLQLTERAITSRTLQPDDLPPAKASAAEGGIADDGWRIAAAIEVGLLCAEARLVVRSRPLKSIIDRLRSARGRALKRSKGNIIPLAKAFEHHRGLVPLPRKCLPDSLAFLAFAARRAHFPHLVFGVEAWPFAAHCWVQSADVVLNDALDHARSFSPILTV